MQREERRESFDVVDSHGRMFKVFRYALMKNALGRDDDHHIWEEIGSRFVAANGREVVPFPHDFDVFRMDGLGIEVRRVATLA
jgi:hypothetical protein